MSLGSNIKEIVKVKNPFFGSEKKNPRREDSDDVEEITQKNFYKYFNNIYLISPLKEPNVSWFEPNVTPEELEDMLNNCLVMKKKISLGKVTIFYEWMKTVPSDILNKCKIGSLDLEEDNEYLVLPIFLLSFDQIVTFMEMYNDKDWFESFLINFKLADSLKVSANFYELKHALDASPTTYWCKDNNTNINVTNMFLNRNFRWNVFKSGNNPSVIKTIQEMKNYNIKDDNYISMFFKTKGNFDDKFGKVNFKLHRLPKIKKIVNHNQFNQIMMEISPRNRFQLFFNVMASPEYCHLVMNNGEIWEMMENVVSRCKPLVRYTMFYSYLSLYLQENIKKTYLTKEDTCILKLSNACKLPTFPYLQSDPNSHPAIAAAHLINDKVIPKQNFYGIPSFTDKFMLSRNQNALCNIPTFKKRLNIFLTGNSNKDILCRMDWNNIHITGSVIAACTPLNHPLVNLFQHSIPQNIESPGDYLYHRYFSEYYGESDVDVLINISDPLELYNRAVKFKQELEEGILYTEGEVIKTKMEIYRKGYFKFNHSFLENELVPYWEKKGTNLVMEQIIEKLSEPETFKYFKPFYEKAKKSFYEKFMEKTEMTDKEKEEKYSFFFNDVKEEDIMLNLYQIVDGKYYKVEKESFGNSINTDESMNDKSFYDVIESTKYKISHPTINHTFELFGVPHEDPWATINKFHMGPVRGYYDGSEVYLTISAIMSFHTNLSPDYRIMFGSKDPAEICNKYRMRGYGVILNKNELAQLVTYSENIPYWRNLYQVNKRNKTSIDKFLSPKKVSDDLFKPRSINSDHYTNCSVYVPLEYSNVNTSYVESSTQFAKDLVDNCQSTNTLVNEIYLKYKFLRSIGKPKPLKRWMIDSAWDLFEMDKIYV